jgi:outer membrane lipoprotein SlyB
VIVRTGSVVEVKAIDLNDGNAVAGALVGGAFGAALTRSSKSSGTRGRNAAIGAVLGGVVAASSRRPGRLYSVAVNDGTIIKIATEQTEIRVDDCVYVEEARGSANIRRAPGAACSPASQTLIAEQEIQDELMIRLLTGP